MLKQFYFKQFSLTLTRISSIWPLDRPYEVLPLWGQSGPGSNGNKGVLHIPQSSSITGTSPSDCLVSYSEHSLGEYHSSANMQSVYSAVTTDWAIDSPSYKIYKVGCVGAVYTLHKLVPVTSMGCFKTIYANTIIPLIPQKNLNIDINENN